MDKDINITMIKGLVGFDGILHYRLSKAPENPLFFWLEAKCGTSFLLTKQIFHFFDYKIEVKDDLMANLTSEEKEPEIYFIVTVPEQPVNMTANLLAPLLINEATGLACQVILQDSHYTTRHYLFPPDKRENCG